MRSIILFCCILLCTNLAGAKDLTGPGVFQVPDLDVRITVPEDWLLRYPDGKVEYFFVNSLAGSIRSLRFSEARREESNNIDMAMLEYRRVQGVYSDRPDVTFTIDDRGQSKAGYYIHYTVSHPRLGISKGFIGCSQRSSNRYLVATGEGTQARVGKRQGWKPTDQDMLEMRKIWSEIEL